MSFSEGFYLNKIVVIQNGSLYTSVPKNINQNTFQNYIPFKNVFFYNVHIIHQIRRFDAKKCIKLAERRNYKMPNEFIIKTVKYKIFYISMFAFMCKSF
jgi:hypothetical protein